MSDDDEPPPPAPKEKDKSPIAEDKKFRSRVMVKVEKLEDSKNPIIKLYMRQIYILLFGIFWFLSNLTLIKVVIFRCWLPSQESYYFKTGVNLW